jgi:dTDP-glucose 4,6-dehydratase
LLITGGAGFIGSHFTEHWLAHHPSGRVVVLDLLTYAGNSDNLAGLAGRDGYRFVQGDICDSALVESLLKAEDIDTLVHFAAESHVDRSIADPAVFVRTNVVGTMSLLEAARRVWLGCGNRHRHRFHHVSTDEVYGSLGMDDPPWTEASPYAPNSPYAASKAASDHLVRAYGRTYGLLVTTSSSANNYGPRQFPEKLVPLAITNVLLGRQVPLYGDGANQREWLHVGDHCHGIERVLQAGQAGEVYHLGGGVRAATNRQLLRALCAEIDRQFALTPSLSMKFPDSPAARGAASESLITCVADRPGHDRRYAASGEKARRELGFTARIDLSRGLSDCVSWYLANHEWWRRRT